MAADTAIDGGLAFALQDVSRAAAFGDLDIVLANNRGPIRRYCNDPVWMHWPGPAFDASAGTTAAGALVWLEGPWRKRRRVRADGGCASAHDPGIVFGLDGADAPSKVRVRWSDGVEQRFGPLAVDLCALRWSMAKQP